MRILRLEKLPVCNCSEYSSELSISHAAASIVITSAASIFSTVCPFSGQNLRAGTQSRIHNFVPKMPFRRSHRTLYAKRITQDKHLSAPSWPPFPSLLVGTLWIRSLRENSFFHSFLRFSITDFHELTIASFGIAPVNMLDKYLD